jgi:hypothetical protein
LFFTEEWGSGPCFLYRSIGGVAQASPEDQIFLLEWEIIGDIWVLYLELDYVSGSPIPPEGGELVFDIFIENWEVVPIDFDTWLAVSYDYGDPTTLVMRHIEDLPPFWSINRPNSWYPVPGTWPSGWYEMILRAGDEPNIVWNEGRFLFQKLGDDPESDFTPRPVTGAPNPFDKILISQTRMPEEQMLLRNFPNPFNPSTVLSYKLQDARKVNLAVYDVSGRKVAELVNGWRDAGVHEVTFDGSDLATGIYLYRLKAGEFVAQGKMVLVK